MKFSSVFLSVAIGSVGASAAATYTLQDAFRVGAFVEKNFTIEQNSGGESEGAIIVGGNFTTGTSPYNVKLRDGAYTVGSSTNVANDVVLAVGGNITYGNSNPEPIKTSGSVVYSGANASSIATNLTARPEITPRNIYSESVDVSQAFSDLRNLSNDIAAAAGGSAYATIASNTLQLPSTTSISLPTLFSGEVFIYNVNASDLDGKSTNGLSGGWPFGADDLVIFNIVGTTGDGVFNYNLDPVALGIGTVTTFGDGSTSSNPWADNILWNISGDVNFQADTSIVGMLLAPNSDFRKGNSTVEGSFIVENLIATGGGELHPITGGGFVIPTPLSEVPEPTPFLAGILLALGLWTRRRC
ncbi:collagen-binding domain-containing protein [Haloferula chungangensis]|uniref:Collagen-binding domain-containing protein n=1 Tax=Haloferula chungangensis TaxID=1048331 RepID=A0ABW2L1J9_9BACT